MFSIIRPANYRNELSRNTLETEVPGELAAKWAERTFHWPELILVAKSGPQAWKFVGFVCALADRKVPLIDNLHVLSEVQSRGMGAKTAKGCFHRTGNERF
jgi:hypothetical protein